MSPKGLPIIVWHAISMIYFLWDKNIIWYAFRIEMVWSVWYIKYDISYDVIWHDKIWLDVLCWNIRYNAILYDMISRYIMGLHMMWKDVIWCDVKGHMIKHDMMIYDNLMIWCYMTWWYITWYMIRYYILYANMWFEKWSGVIWNKKTVRYDMRNDMTKSIVFHCARVIIIRIHN